VGVFIIDTNVISELRRPLPHAGVVAWFEHVGETKVALPAMVIGEIQAGIEATRRTDPQRALEIETWLETLDTNWDILPMDAASFQMWAKFMHGKSADLTEDAMIAATAAVLGWTVATRNTKDFANFDVAVYNPFLYRC
jgi:toxin FitB